ncbi:MAG TPA: hypothetical protein VLT47_10805 [Anaeromyxobacteraceae bacterium]|nr:hypothetical protein [Anaeromyxobacteraceae bacterium]
MAVEDAAAVSGLGEETIRRYVADPERGRQAAIAAPPTPTPAAASPTPPAATQAPPRAEASAADPARRSALLALLSQALDADAALVAALPLDVAILARRLGDDGQDDPMPPEALHDPAVMLRWVAELLARDLRRMDPKALAARKQAAAVLVTLASGQDRILRSRPVGETPEQIVQRRLAEAKDAAIDRIGILTSEARARLESGRADFDAWAAQNLGPVLGAEVVRRVGMLFGDGQEVAA